MMGARSCVVCQGSRVMKTLSMFYVCGGDPKYWFGEQLLCFLDE